MQFTRQRRLRRDVRCAIECCAVAHQAPRRVPQQHTCASCLTSLYNSIRAKPHENDAFIVFFTIEPWAKPVSADVEPGMT
jgi:hypothetical protein